MKTVGILLIGSGTGLAFLVSKANPEQALDSLFLLIFSGIWFLTAGLFTDTITSQHSNNKD